MVNGNNWNQLVNINLSNLYMNLLYVDMNQLSYAGILKLAGKRWKQLNKLSLCNFKENISK